MPHRTELHGFVLVEQLTQGVFVYAHDADLHPAACPPSPYATLSICTNSSNSQAAACEVQYFALNGACQSMKLICFTSHNSVPHGRVFCPPPLVSTASPLVLASASCARCAIQMRSQQKSNGRGSLSYFPTFRAVSDGGRGTFYSMAR